MSHSGVASDRGGRGRGGGGGGHRSGGHGGSSAGGAHSEERAMNYKDRRRAAVYQSPDIYAAIEGAVPRSLDVIEFAASRSTELTRLTALVAAKSDTESGGGRRVFQSLPRHLRRRAMSHNLHRLPWRLRAAARREIERGMASKDAESGSEALTNHRRKRRRPTNMLASHAHRQRQHTWLETHLWHAKRMHMANCWGHRLAQSATQKGARASYKSNLHLATVYDASYVAPVSVTGTQANIAALVSEFAGGDSAAVSSAQYVDGSREGMTMLYQRGTFPHGMIAPVTFHWQPLSMSQSQSRELWLWVHAAVFDEVLSLLNAASANHQCAVTSLRGQLCRFELTGARCQSVLATVLKPVAQSPVSCRGTSLWSLLCDAQLRSPSSLPSSVIVGVECQHPETLKGTSRIKQPFKVHTDNSSSHTATASAGSDAQSAALIEALTNWPLNASVSVLWDEAERSRLTGSTAWGKKRDRFAQRLRDREVAKALLQPQAVVAVSETEEKNASNETSTVTTGTKMKRPPPVKRALNPPMSSNQSVSLHALLIQRPHCHHASQSRSHQLEHQRGIGSGWDVVVPAGWGTIVWRALVYAGARAIGLHERARFTNEQGALAFPQDFPDCLAGYLTEHYSGQQAAASWLRHPIDKRVNYAKNGILAPWQPAWSKLFAPSLSLPPSLPTAAEFTPELAAIVCCTAHSTESINATKQSTIPPIDAAEPQSKRQKALASEKQSAVMTDDEDTANECESVSMIEDDDAGAALSHTKVLTDQSVVLPYYVLRNWRSLLQSLTAESLATALAAPKYQPALMAVNVSVMTRGAIDDLVHIYLPTIDDLTSILTKHSTLTDVADSDSDGGSHSDGKGRWQGFDEPIHSRSQSSSGVQCTRQLIGFVTSGGQSFLHSKGEGVGHCSVSGVVAALTLSREQFRSAFKCFVLVRLVSSRSYRPAILTLR